MIGMLMPAIHDLHGEQWLGAVEAATVHECDLICFCGGELDHSERSGQANVIYDLATAETLDALVVWTSALATKVGRERLEKFFSESEPIPIVAVEQPMFDAPVVRMANQNGMRDAVSHLIEVHGCQRIAFVRGPGTVDAAVERYQGYLDALRQHGLAVHPELVSPHLRTWTPEESAAWVTDMLRAADVPDAIAASNDDLAAGVIHALETADLDHVPVIGFDDFTKFRSDELGFARGSDADASIRRQVAMNVNTVSLTTVHAPFQEMGRRSVEVALALIRGDPVSEESSRVPTELVVRRSCGCLPTVSPAMPAAAGAAGELATHLRQALTHPSDELPADWAERLMAAFVREMRGESSGAFARLLDSLIQLSMRSGEGAGDWSRVLFTLRPLIGSARNVAETVRAEDAWRRAHMLLTDTADRHHWRFMRALVETRNQVLREVGQQLITAADLDVPYDFESMGKAGSMLGSGAIIVVDDSTPILDVAMKVAKFYRHESCGKCTPCREGTNWTVKMLERIDRGEATPIDLEIMASVQEHIIGNCLCVLGDAMAMPIGSMIEKFRAEFEAHMEQARQESGVGALAASDSALAAQGALESEVPPPGELGARGAGAQAPGERGGEPGTQKGGA